MSSSPSAPPPTIAVVGGGASGTLVAVQLLRQARRPLRVLLFERSARIARGIAYSTESDLHLLNVRANRMSAFPDLPSHFVDWLQATPEVGFAQVDPNDFVPRKVYPRYLIDTLRDAQAAAAQGVTLEVRQAEVCAVDPEQGLVRLADGALVPVDRTVLALGNAAPPPLASFDDPRIAENPWSPAALDGLEPNDAVLFVGTGLTFFDLAVTLLAERGHRGQLYAVSRRGLLSQQHQDSGTTREWTDADLPATALGALRAVRKAIRAAQAEGADWRDVIDSLRPQTKPFWEHLPLAERERFVRHVVGFWDPARHRVAPQVGRPVFDAADSGQLQIIAGRVRALTPSAQGVHVGASLRQGGEWSATVARVINCTGPATRLSEARNPLIDDLVARGHARPSPLGVGLETGGDGHLVDSRGNPSARLSTIGPLRRAELWETTAVPSIREQAPELARRLLAELDAL